MGYIDGKCYHIWQTWILWVTMVYGRYNELVNGDFFSWFINQQTLLGGDWNMAGLWLSHHIGNFIFPTDELHHFSEGLTPPTSVRWTHGKSVWPFPEIYIHRCNLNVYIYIYIYTYVLYIYMALTIFCFIGIGENLWYHDHFLFIRLPWFWPIMNISNTKHVRCARRCCICWGN